MTFYRPADIRASLNNLTISTFEAEKRKAMQKKAMEEKPPPAKRPRTTVAVKSRKGKGKEKEKNPEKEAEEATYHFIGYVPAYGKVWELDGLKSGPLEVGELPAGSTSSSTSSKDPNRGWMDVVRPALRMKMEKYGGSGNAGSNIRFSLLAIVDDLYQKASDELELLRREKIALERRMEAGWESLVSFSSITQREPLGRVVTLNSICPPRSIRLFMNLQNQHLSYINPSLMRRTLGRGGWTEISRL